MSGAKQSLTGIWHGLYTYAGEPEPVYFVATLIHSGATISGATHESEVGAYGAPLVFFARIDGSVTGQVVSFAKTYDGTGGWEHAVNYDGLLSADRSEIEGRWTIGAAASGQFLMIRASGASESMVRKKFARA